MGDSVKFEITAPIFFIGPEVQVSEKFRKREFVLLLDKDSKWPQTVPFIATGDRIEKLDEFGEGDVVEVTFELRGREWKPAGKPSRYFGENTAFKIERVGEKRRSPPPPSGGGYGAADEGEIPFIDCSPEVEPIGISRIVSRRP